jgi:Fe-S cluster assembly protein SufD
MSGATADQLNQAESNILEKHRGYLTEAKPDASLLALNQAALVRFETLGFPHRKHEMYTFANTTEMASTDFSLTREGPVEAQAVQAQIYPGCETSCLVLVDGRLSETLSDTSAFGDRLKVTSLADALSDASLNQYILDTIENENDVFACLNSGFFNPGILLDVEAKTVLETPLQILHFSTGSKDKPVTTHPRVLIRLGAHAEMQLIIKYAGFNGNYFVNSVQDILMGENASLTVTQTQQDHADAWHCSKTRASLKNNSRFLATNASSGCKLARHHYDLFIKEPGAELELNGISVLDGEEQVHNFIRIHHEAPHCNSRQHFKNIVNGNSRSSIDGTVIVNQGAQLTSSDQLINNLMLSDGAHADNKPNLMIFADDVKCTHGATVGQIEEEQLFYLKTRGLAADVAKALLTKSFAESIIQRIHFPAVAADLENTLLRKLEA